MKTYCVSCKKHTANKNSSVNRLIFGSSCDIFGKKKPGSIKDQEASGLLSKLGIRTPLINIPLIGDILF